MESDPKIAQIKFKISIDFVCELYNLATELSHTTPNAQLESRFRVRYNDLSRIREQLDASFSVLTAHLEKQESKDELECHFNKFYDKFYTIQTIYEDLDQYNEYSGINYEENVPSEEEPTDDDPEQCPEESQQNVPSHDENRVQTNTVAKPNILILSNKSYPRSINLGNLNISVEDCGERLNTSSCYCKECMTFFTTKNALDAHKISVHSSLVAEEAPKEQNDPKPKHKFCNHCQSYFEDEALLIQHLYDSIKANSEEQPPSKSSTSSEIVNTPPQSDNTYMRCKICSCLFSIKSVYDKHCVVKHGAICPPNEAHVPDDNLIPCKFCNALNTGVLKYNKHIYKHHYTEYFQKAADYVEKEKNAVQTIVSKATNVATRSGVSSMNLTELQKHSHENAEKAKSKSLVKHTDHIQNDKRLYYRGGVPVNALYKCTKCSLFFLYCYAGVRHVFNPTTTHNIKQGTWKCLKCNRIFRISDSELHMLQHKHTRDFRVYEIHQNIYVRALCRCSKCNIYFEERLYPKHRELGCKINSQVGYCSICDLYVNNYNMHEAKHSVDHLMKSDFILTDFVHDDETHTAKRPYEKITDPNLKRPNTEYSRLIPKKKFSSHLIEESHRDIESCTQDQTGSVPSMKLYECSYCKSLFSHKEDHDNHERKCDFHDNTKCPCGLNHIEKIYKCNHCDVYMLSKRAADSHNHRDHLDSTVEPCSICGWNFSSKALRVHFSTHHLKLKLSRDQFCIIPIANEDNVSADKYRKNSDKSIHNAIGSVDNSTNEKTSGNNSLQKSFTYSKLRKMYKDCKNVLFRCAECDICYLTIETWLGHTHNNSSGRILYKCTKCQARFTTFSMKKHQYNHEANPEIVYEVIDPCETSTRSLGPIRKSSSEEFAVKDVEVASTLKSKKSVETHSANEISQPSPEPAQTTAQPEQPQINKASMPQRNSSTPPKRYTHKLYKCGECNIYFVGQQASYSHILNHTQIDSMEFLECKLCSFPFKIRSLHLHMKKHHNKDFNLDEVLIEEYTKDGDNRKPKIQIYYAVDKVQSRMISTTLDENKYDTDLTSNHQTSSSTNTVEDLVNIFKEEDSDVVMETQSSFVDHEIANKVSADIKEEINLNDDVRPEENVVNEKHKCRFCDDVFNSKTSKEFHESLDHFDAEKNCEICKSSFNASILNALHLNIKDDTFQCCLCNDRFGIQELTSHAQMHVY